MVDSKVVQLVVDSVPRKMVYSVPCIIGFNLVMNEKTSFKLTNCPTLMKNHHQT